MSEPSLPEESIFSQALEIESAAERAAFLDQACANNSALRAEVEALLRAAQKSGDSLDPLENPAATAAPQDGSAGSLRSTVAEGSPATPRGEAKNAAESPLHLGWAATSRYRALRFHARGGLGEVHVALDAELHREVALKRMQPARAVEAESVRRFLLEAEITGRLEHPGVVPVYGLVQDADGQPCYAMRFVEGESLKDAITRFHSADQPYHDPGERRLAMRQLLSHFVAVCNTVAYAHSRGIIHRDLKPSNILLGRFGETLLVDWGLAKPFERTKAERAAGEATLAPASDSGEGGTRLGQAVGTPAYMSPEQASGRWDRVGPASDIYGLGATLYAVLTGQPPYSSQEGDVLARVERGEFPPPRWLKPDMPRPLEAICLKALALWPENRYATALELAADVEHWLADEPVAVYHEPLPARLGRWGRQNRPWVVGVVALLVTAVLALAVGLGFVKQEQVRTEQQRQQALAAQARAEQHQQRAEASYRLAREGLDQGLRKVRDDPRLRGGPLEDLRRLVLEAEKVFYEKFVQLHGDEPDFQAERGTAFVLLAGVTAELGSKEEATGHYREAVAIFADLAKNHPEAATHRFTLARAHNNLGDLHKDLGRPAEGEPAYKEALALYQALVGDHPDVLQYQIGLAAVYDNLGLLYQGSKRPRDAEQAHLEALAHFKALARNHPSDLDCEVELAKCQLNIGVFYMSHGPAKKAEDSLREAQVLLKALAGAHPDVAAYLADLAKAHNNLGALYEAMQRPEEAEQAYRDALEPSKSLVRDHPLVTEYALSLGGTHCNLGLLVLDGGRPEASLAWFADAAATLEPLLARQPRHITVRDFLRNLHLGRGEALTRLGRHAEALQDWDRGIERDDGKYTIHFRLQRAITLARLKDHGRASAEADALAKVKGATGGLLYDLACVYAVSAAAAGADPTLPDKYASRAVQLLRQACAKGYKDLAHMKNDTDLDTLRQRPDFRKLLNELEKQ